MVNFIILMILHVIGDFYLQTNKVAKCKNARIDANCGECTSCKDKSNINIKYILIHVLIYMIPFVAMFALMNWKQALISFGVVAVSHGIIDIIACCLYKRWKQTLTLVLDQIMHFAVIYGVWKMCSFSYTHAPFENISKFVLVILLLAVPSSVLISKLFDDIYVNKAPESTEDTSGSTEQNKLEEKDSTGIFSSGSIIGILERMLVMLFACFGEFAAIAIVITIKTWARSNDLKEKDFRDKYLLGTLSSLVCALAVYIFFGCPGILSFLGF